jgi:hypothetical protein
VAVACLGHLRCAPTSQPANNRIMRPAPPQKLPKKVGASTSPPTRSRVGSVDSSQASGRRSSWKGPPMPNLPRVMLRAPPCADAPPTGGVGRARCGTAKRLLWFTRLGSRRRKRRAASIFGKSFRLSDQRFCRPSGHSRRPCRCEWQVPARLERRVGALRLRAAISRQARRFS